MLKGLLQGIEGCARGCALFFGFFCLSNLLAMILVQGSGIDSNIWWIDLRGWPIGLSLGLLGSFALFMIAFAFVPVMGKKRRLTEINEHQKCVLASVSLNIYPVHLGNQ